MPAGEPLYAQLQDDVRAGHGNALQACVASILARPLATVPNFIEDPDGYATAIARYCAACVPGVAFEKVALVASSASADASATYAMRRLPAGHEMAPGSRIIVRGMSPRGEFGHVVVGVVAADGRSVSLDRSASRKGPHDPHPSGGMLRPPLLWAGLFRGLKMEFEIATLPFQSIRTIASYLSVVEQMQGLLPALSRCGRELWVKRGGVSILNLSPRWEWVRQGPFGFGSRRGGGGMAMQSFCGLRELHITGARGCHPEDLGALLSESCKSLRVLDISLLSNSQVNLPMRKVAASLSRSSLEEEQREGTKTKSSSARPVSRHTLESLEVLRLKNVTANDLGYFMESSVLGEGGAALQELEILHNLDVGDSEVRSGLIPALFGDADRGKARAHLSLRRLTIDRCPISDLSAIQLVEALRGPCVASGSGSAPCGLRHLRLRCGGAGRAGSHLTDSTVLAIVAASGNSGDHSSGGAGSGAGVSPTNKKEYHYDLSALSTLSLPDCVMSAPVTAKLAASYPFLISLELSGHAVTNEVAQALSCGAWRLRDLSLRSSAMTDRGVEMLFGSVVGVTLQRLDVSWSKLVGDKAVEGVAEGLPQLQELVAMRTKISDRGLRVLCKRVRQHRDTVQLRLVDVRQCEKVFVSDQRFRKAVQGAAALLPLALRVVCDPLGDPLL